MYTTLVAEKGILKHFSTDMNSQTFFHISRVARSDDPEKNFHGKQKNNFATIRNIWNIWVEIFHNILKPVYMVHMGQLMNSWFRSEELAHSDNRFIRNQH